MFNLSEFIVTNIVNGVKNRTFTKEYANIMAVNYMLKGVLNEDDVVSINSQIEMWEIEQTQKSEVNNEFTVDEKSLEVEEGAEVIQENIVNK